MAGANQNRNQQNGNKKKYIQESDCDKSIVYKALDDIHEQYDRTAKRHGLHAEEEFAFIWTIFTSNLTLLKKACDEPDQFKRALLTQASIGLTFDPSKALVYLVVRQYKLICDIGYRGLIKIAVDEGLIKKAKPELVYEKDNFEFLGPNTIPNHKNDKFFGERGAIIGAYVIATLPDDTPMVETMRESEFAEIASLNNKSDAWAKEFSKGEMRKKTLLKRASKWWYNSAASGEASGRLESTIEYLNEAGEGLDFNKTTEADDASAQLEQSESDAIEVPADELVSDKIKIKVATLIERARAANAWEPAADYLAEKYTGSDLLWAKNQLAQAVPQET